LRYAFCRRLQSILRRAGPVARFARKILRRCVFNFVSGKSVLELGCGEGHLTQAILGGARSITGVDISDVAIARAMRGSKLLTF
jgi:predicted TPR repeat methyltransferase